MVSFARCSWRRRCAFQVLHEQNVFMTVEFRDVPFVEGEHRIECKKLDHDCWQVKARYGFMETPDVASGVELCSTHGLQVEPMDVTYFLSREKVVPGPRVKGPALWRDKFFAAMARNAGDVTDFFNIPANRVVELGTRVEI